MVCWCSGSHLFGFSGNLQEKDMVDYEVVAEQGIRLNRRHAKGETVKLSPGQARYLLLNGKIRPVEPTAPVVAKKS